MQQGTVEILGDNSLTIKFHTEKIKRWSTIQIMSEYGVYLIINLETAKALNQHLASIIRIIEENHD